MDGENKSLNPERDLAIVRLDHAREDLDTAVLVCGSGDYRSAAKMIAETGSRFEKKRLEREMKSISRFFLGDWYLLLSGRDNGPQILERLDQEVFKND